jgi:uncharacterized protein YciI
MLYAILGRDGPGALQIRRRVRPQHLERVRVLAAAGRVVLAGPLPAVDAADPGEAGFAGSLIVAEFASLADARAWAEQDPYVTEGVFVSISVEPFVKVLP